MTTGRINQVTLVKRTKEKKDRALAHSLSKVSILFSSPEQLGILLQSCLDQEVLLGVIVSIQRGSTHVCNNDTFVVRQSPSMSVICSKHPIAKSLIFFPRTEH